MPNSWENVDTAAWFCCVRPSASLAAPSGVLYSFSVFCADVCTAWLHTSQAPVATSRMTNHTSVAVLAAQGSKGRRGG